MAEILPIQSTCIIKSNFDCLDNTPATQINKVVSHPTMGVSITAHEDRFIRFFDNNTGKKHCFILHM